MADTGREQLSVFYNVSAPHRPIILTLIILIKTAVAARYGE
jgi:hypothetical protein